MRIPRILQCFVRSGQCVNHNRSFLSPLSCVVCGSTGQLGVYGYHREVNLGCRCLSFNWTQQQGQEGIQTATPNETSSVKKQKKKHERLETETMSSLLVVALWNTLYFKQRLNAILWFPKRGQDVWQALKLDFDQPREEGSANNILNCLRTKP